MAAEATPRVNAKYLAAFTNKTDAHLTLHNAVELIGKVMPDLSVKAWQSTDFGNNIDFAAVEALVEATHRYKEIFYESTDQ